MSKFSFANLLLGAFMFVSCASQQGVIARPDWAEKPAIWEYTGLTLATYGSAQFSQQNPEENARAAEEKALQNLRHLLAQELAKAYIKSGKASISEEEATRQLENKIGNLLERQHHYDEQRHVYFVQLFIPASRVEEYISQVFGTQLQLKADGTLG